MTGSGRVLTIMTMISLVAAGCGGDTATTTSDSDEATSIVAETTTVVVTTSTTSPLLVADGVVRYTNLTYHGGSDEQWLPPLLDIYTSVEQPTGALVLVL